MQLTAHVSARLCRAAPAWQGCARVRASACPRANMLAISTATSGADHVVHSR